MDMTKWVRQQHMLCHRTWPGYLRNKNIITDHVWTSFCHFVRHQFTISSFISKQSKLSYMFYPCFYTMCWFVFKWVYEWPDALWFTGVCLCVCVCVEWLGLLPGECGRRPADDSRTVRGNDSREPEPWYAVHRRTKRKVSLRPHLECLSSHHLHQPDQLD